MTEILSAKLLIILALVLGGIVATILYTTITTIHPSIYGNIEYGGVKHYSQTLLLANASTYFNYRYIYYVTVCGKGTAHLKPILPNTSGYMEGLPSDIELNGCERFKVNIYTLEPINPEEFMVELSYSGNIVVLTLKG